MIILAGGVFDGETVHGATTLTVEEGVITRLEAGHHRRVGETAVDLRDRFVLPAFVNVHTHLGMTLLRGVGDGLPLERWLNEAIWPLEAQLTADDVYWGTLLGLAEAIRTGTGTVADMYFHMEAVAEAVAASGIRAVLARGLVAEGEAFQQRLQEGLALYRRWHGYAGRLRVMLGPHALYSLAPSALAEVAETARRLGVGVHLHLLETRGEAAEVEQTTGHRPLALLRHLGFGDLPILAAHMVHPRAEDWQEMQGLDLTIASCPVSNLALGSGLPPIGAYVAAGIPLGLGTDGATPAGTLDMYLHLKALVWVERGRRGDAAGLPALQALQIATAGGGRALRWPRLGTLTPGAPADLQAVQLSSLWTEPVDDPLAALVGAALGGLVQDTFVAGRPLLRQGELVTLRQADILRQVRHRRQRLRPPKYPSQPSA